MLAMQRRIITAQKGSWKWHDAFRVVEYYLEFNLATGWIWRGYNHSRKMSYPQLVKWFGKANLPKWGNMRSAATQEELDAIREGKAF